MGRPGPRACVAHRWSWFASGAQGHGLVRLTGGAGLRGACRIPEPSPFAVTAHSHAVFLCLKRWRVSLRVRL